MDLTFLINFFSTQVFSHLPAAVYTAQLIARTIMGILNKIGFNFETFTKLLVQANVKFQGKFIHELFEVANKGVDTLSEWIKDKLQTPEVTQTMGEILATNALEIGEAFDQAVTEPGQRKSVAQKVDESMKEVEGITQSIPADIYTILLDTEHRAELVGMLQDKLGVHPFQEQIAEEYSKIIESKQAIKGKIDAKQKQKAKDHSTIKGSSQSIQIDGHD